MPNHLLRNVDREILFAVVNHESRPTVDRQFDAMILNPIEKHVPDEGRQNRT